MLATLHPFSMRDPFSATQRRLTRFKARNSVNNSSTQPAPTATNTRTTSKSSTRAFRKRAAAQPAPAANAAPTTSEVTEPSRASTPTTSSEVPTAQVGHDSPSPQSVYSSSSSSPGHSTEQLSLNPLLLQLPASAEEEHESSPSSKFSARSFFTSFSTRFGPMFSPLSPSAASSTETTKKSRRVTNKKSKSAVKPPSADRPPAVDEVPGFTLPEQLGNEDAYDHVEADAGLEYIKPRMSGPNMIDMMAMEDIIEDRVPQLLWPSLPNYEPGSGEDESVYTAPQTSQYSFAFGDAVPVARKKRSYEDLVMDSSIPCEPPTAVHAAESYFGPQTAPYQAPDQLDELSLSPHGSKRLAVQYELPAHPAADTQIYTMDAIIADPAALDQSNITYSPVMHTPIESIKGQLSPHALFDQAYPPETYSEISTATTSLRHATSSPQLYTNSTYHGVELLGDEHMHQFPMSHYSYASSPYSAFAILAPAPQTVEQYPSRPASLPAPRSPPQETREAGKLESSPFVNLTIEHKDAINKAVAKSGSGRRKNKRVATS